MSQCFHAPRPTALDARLRGRACRRLAAAVAASVVVHAWLAAEIRVGPAAGSGDAMRWPSITATLERSVTAPTLERFPEPREAAQKRAVASPVRQRTAARRSLPEEALPRAASGTTGSNLTEAPDTTYYAARQLDVYPALAVPLNLPYPTRALEAGIEGRALLLLHIDEAGAVGEVVVVEAQPAGYFETDARRAFLAARFNPGQKNGRAVRSRVLVQVTYGDSAAR